MVPAFQAAVSSLDAGYHGPEFWFRGNKTDRAEGRNKFSHLPVAQVDELW